MVSGMSQIVVNLYMEALETWNLERVNLKHKFWLRYVDDVFAIREYGSNTLKPSMIT